MTSELYRSLKREEKRIEMETSREGVVTVRHHVLTDGTGRYTVSEPLMFGVGFIGRPELRWASEVEQWDEDGLPMTTVGVREWIRNDDGHYVGAYIYLAVF